MYIYLRILQLILNKNVFIESGEIVKVENMRLVYPLDLAADFGVKTKANY